MKKRGSSCHKYPGGGEAGGRCCLSVPAKRHFITVGASWAILGTAENRRLQVRAGQVLSGAVPPAMQGGYARLSIGRELMAHRLNHLGEGHGCDVLGDEGAQLRVGFDLRGAPTAVSAHVIGSSKRRIRFGAELPLKHSFKIVQGGLHRRQRGLYRVRVPDHFSSPSFRQTPSTHFSAMTALRQIKFGRVAYIHLAKPND